MLAYTGYLCFDHLLCQPILATYRGLSCICMVYMTSQVSPKKVETEVAEILSPRMKKLVARMKKLVAPHEEVGCPHEDVGCPEVVEAVTVVTRVTTILSPPPKKPS